MDEVHEKLRKLAPVARKEAEALWSLYVSETLSERAEIEDLIDLVAFQNTEADFRETIELDPADSETCFGEYELGEVLYPGERGFCTFGVREGEFLKHILITGQTGSGKTNLVYVILRELRRHRKPFMVFDWKSSFRDLIWNPEFRTLRIHTVGRDITPFAFNPLLPPPGATAGEWLMKLVDVIKHSYFLGMGAEYVLREAIDEVYEGCGMYENGDRALVPTFEAVRDCVRGMQMQGRMGLWKASVMRAVEAMCFRHGLGPVLNTDKGMSPEVLDESVVLELDSLSDADKTFFVEALILWIYEYRRREGKREEFKHLICIEESHHVLSRHKEHSAGEETIMETCLRQIRELGEGFIAIDQEPSKLSDSIRANTFCKVTFNLGNGSDIHEISRAMGLTQEEEAYIHLLDVGKAIVSMKGRVFVPLYVRFPKFDVVKGSVTDEHLKSRFQ